MAVLTIPVKDLAFQTFSIVLENNSYDLTLQWNDRDESWHLSLARSGYTPLFKTKITNGTDLLRKCRAYQSCPKGLMFVVDSEKDWGRLQRDSFSSGRFVLYYIDEFDRELLETIGR
jgi:hypothetical protein